MSSFSAKARRWVSKIINAGITDQTGIEKARKIMVLNLFSLVGFSITFLLGIRGASDGEWPLAFALFFAFALFLSVHLRLRFSRNDSSYRYGASLVQTVLFLLCLYLVYSGGANNTGPLWIYLLPPVVMFLSGLRMGMAVVGLFVVMYSIIVFFPDNAIGAVAYSYEFKTRLLYSFLTLTFLSGVYEHSRQSSYTKLNELKKDFELQATQDSLTHLLNRRGMRERILYETERSKRNNSALSFIISDVDYFKEINDTYGHDTGDAILIQISQIMQSSIRKQDSLSRWGGEEFLLLLPETTSDQAWQLADKIRLKVEEFTFGHVQNEVQATVSFGVAEVADLADPRQAISLADQRLYQAKKAGRNRVIGDD